MKHNNEPVSRDDSPQSEVLRDSALAKLEAANRSKERGNDSRAVRLKQQSLKDLRASVEHEIAENESM